jgi:hypothetical protein
VSRDIFGFFTLTMVNQANDDTDDGDRKFYRKIPPQAAIKRLETHRKYEISLANKVMGNL